MARTVEHGQEAANAFSITFDAVDPRILLLLSVVASTVATGLLPAHPRRATPADWTAAAELTRQTAADLSADPDT